MRPLSLLKRLTNHLLARYGHAVAHTSVVPSFERLVELLERYGLRPRTVIDIGVADGTPWLYEALPDASYVLVDPTRESLPHMERWARTLRAKVLNVALGEHEGATTIRIRDDGIGGSSFFAEVGPCRLVTTYDVPVRRFDAAIGPIERPCLCKIDVQGAEGMVLRGMGDRIAELDVIVVETSVVRTLHGEAPEFGDIVVAMRDRGFVLYDIVGMLRRPLDGCLTQVDAVFVPEHSALRSDRRWTAVG
jgi:FkbM family methyltransferase